MNRNVIIVSIISAVLLFGLLWMSYSLTNQPEQKVVVESAKVIEPTDHVKWSTEKKHILTEYSDLQCPACKAFHSYIKANIEKSDTVKNVTFVYRHFPLKQTHQYAQEAAYAAEAAGKQGKFFEMHDLLFETQDTWSSEGNSKGYFEKLAKQLKLNVEKFKTDMNSPEVKQQVESDYQKGQASYVNATPTFFLDGEKLNPRSFDEFAKMLSDLK